MKTKKESVSSTDYWGLIVVFSLALIALISAIQIMITL